MRVKIPQNVCGKPFNHSNITKILELIKANPHDHRNALAKKFCKEFNWISPNGRYKEMSCKVAMLKLHREGLIKLPPARRLYKRNKKQRITSASDPQYPIEQNITEILAIELLPVKTPEESRLWNELIERYHYLGFKTLPGAQIRYLIYCSQGLLGAVSFSASAWKTAPRDTWIGWNHKIREKNLHLIVNNSRYLILPWVKIKHLASKVLSLCAKRIRTDWQERYAYKPVLIETFVEKDKFKGTCYKAANWICVGQTQGRGKKDVHKEYKLPIKDIWIYPLTKDFRQTLQSVI